MKKHWLLLFWYFLVAPYGVNYSFSVIGPYANQQQCEQYRQLVHWAVEGKCWNDGRPDNVKKEDK